jgi:hypothetical protein
MTYSQLDYYFPFIVLSYGFFMTVILHTDFVAQFAREKLQGKLFVQFQSHRALGLVALVVGGLWSLQNLILG